MAYMTWIQYSMGHVQQAEEYSARVQEFTAKINNRLISARIDWIVSMYYSMSEDWKRAEKFSRRFLDTANELNTAMTQGVSSAIYYTSRAMQSENDQYIRQFETGLEAYEASGAQFFTIQTLAHLAQALIKHGHTQEGLEILRKAMGRVSEQGERYFEVEVHRLIAIAHLSGTRPDRTATQSSLLRALDIAESGTIVSFGLRAAVRLAELWISQGQYGETAEMLDRYLRKFPGEKALPKVREARVLHANLTNQS